MNLNRTHTSLSFVRTTGFALALALPFAAGCKKADEPVAATTPAAAPDDNSLAASVQSKISANGALSSEPIQVGVSSGVVTLNGNVSNAAAKILASNDAASVAGVKTVINNLGVQTATPAPATTMVPEPAPIKTRPVKPAPVIVERAPAPMPAPVSRPAPVQVVRNEPPPPPAAPTTKTVTVQAGSYIPIRITQGLDSATTQTGDSFTGVISNDIVEDGWVAIRQGTPVSGRVVEAKDASHFKGSALLSIELTTISRRGERIAISTEPYSQEGKGRGANTATKAGVGAAAGAILGGIFGGGKGAAIGAAAGGGAGVGVNAITKGQQVQIPSETMLRFRLTNSFSVVATPAGASDAPGRRPLQ